MTWSAPFFSEIETSHVEVIALETARVFEEVTRSSLPPNPYSLIDTISFTRLEIFCPFPPNYTCNGLTDFQQKKITVLLRGGCLPMTSLIHEFIHVLAVAAGREDHDHIDPLLFKAASREDFSVEYQTEERTRALLCK